MPKINKKEQIRERLMSWYQNDIPTMERKVANYRHIVIPDKDPFLLFKILQVPNSNDLSEYCNRDSGKEKVESRMSDRPKSRHLILDKAKRPDGSSHSGTGKCMSQAQS